MGRVLHVSVDDAKLHPAVHRLTELLATNAKAGGIELRVANRLWGQQGFRFQPAFLKLTRDDYGAELSPVDFGKADAARDQINAWVEEQTNRKIQDLIPKGVLSKQTRLVLTNAVYFKAAWTDQFNAGATQPEPFHVSPERDVQTPMMRHRKNFSYGENDDWQALALPYGDRQDLTMLVLLPKRMDGLPQLEKDLTAKAIETLVAGMRRESVYLRLPKFKITSTLNLKETLAALGMPLAFSDDADFSAMSSQEGLTLSAAIHKAFIHVDEEGTEAAAATAMAAVKSAQPEKFAEFHADHPFLFLIRERQTGSILFLGRLSEPTTDGQ
jgi:serpin B